ncbi:MAG: hypothetical protein R3A46_04775 [Thermomicrobiales bacterium]
MAGPEVFGTNPYAANRPVQGKLVTLLRGVVDNRGLQLESYRSRAVLAGHVHELMTTDEVQAEPGATVDRVGLIGFFAVEISGVLLVGSRISVGGRELGTIAGFDDTHMPNHQNICVKVDEIQDGSSLGYELEALVRFE